MDRTPYQPNPAESLRWASSLFPPSRAHPLGWCVAAGFAVLLLLPRPSWGLWVPGMGIGGAYQPNFAAGAANGGSVLQADFGYMWEWPNLSLTASLPIETDFGTRLAVGPQVRFGVYRYFRFLFAPMVDIPFRPEFYSLFFLRGGVEAGYRNTGRYAEASETPLKAGLYLFIHVDYRVPMPGQGTGQELRMAFGIRLEVGM